MRGSKKSYTAKQKRMASKIEKGEKKKHGAKRAKAIAWATVNKKTGGGKKKKATATKRTTRKKAKK